MSAEALFTTPNDLEARAVRDFDAPRDLVWEAYTNPKYVAQWVLGPEGWSMPVCEIDLRPGGEWHFVWRKDDGSEMEMRGRYLEIERPERLVNTEKWGEEWPETVNTLVLAEHGDATRLTLTIRYPSLEARDRALQTGMSEGASMSYDRLARLIETMA